MLFEDPESELRFAQATADVKDVARSCSRPSGGAPGSDFSYDCHIYKNLVAPCRVSACQYTLKPDGSALQAAQEQVQPSASMRFRQSQTEQEAAWIAAHRCYIANRPGKALPADSIRRVLLPQEVRSFQKQVARENRLVTGLRTEERSVIADAESDGSPSSVLPWSGAIRNLSQDGILALMFPRH